MLEDLISHRKPPPNRASACTDDMEHHLTEGAVMVAFALHLLRTVDGLKDVSIHPDGEHGKWFNFRSWLEAQGFVVEPLQLYGWIKTTHGLRPIKRDSFGADLLAVARHRTVFVQCKGGETWRSGLAAARDLFAQYPLGPYSSQWILGWNPRAHDPEIIIVAEGPCEAMHPVLIPARRRPKPLPLFSTRGA